MRVNNSKTKGEVFMLRMNQLATKSVLGLFGAVIGGTFMSSGANASLVGDSVGIVEYYPTIGTVYGPPAPQQVIQPSGNTFSDVGNSRETIVVGASVITLTADSPYTPLSATFDGVEITDYNSLNTITNASLDATSLPLPSGFLYFDSHDIFVNVEGVDLTSPIVIDVSSSVVPEPASLSVLMIAPGLMLMRRRSKGEPH
jgi:hypothetical protein